MRDGMGFGLKRGRKEKMAAILSACLSELTISGSLLKFGWKAFYLRRLFVLSSPYFCQLSLQRLSNARTVM